MQIHWTPIEDVVQEAAQTYTFRLKTPDGFTWEEGAHTHFALEGFNAGDAPNRSLIRHMSISTLPDEGVIGITTRIQDECSEFKSLLRGMARGETVALFKTYSNVPLKRDGRPIVLLSSGVGLATFRPLVKAYRADATGVPLVRSLNVDSSGDFLFRDVFTTDEQMTSTYVASRQAYYTQLDTLTQTDGWYYVVGSDDFLRDTIQALRANGIAPDQILLDKHDVQRETFLA